MRWSETFPAEPTSVPAARRFATKVLGDSPASVREAVELMVSELATNGIRHAGTSFELVIERLDGEIRVAVTDRGGGTPRMRFPGPDEPTGRGLQIVEMLSDRWGVDHDPDFGKTVWFTVSARSPGGAFRSESPGGSLGTQMRRSAWRFLVASLPHLAEASNA
jgi:anti-sigma regulatory factor (Ser/Thr protein kinase)